jgi:hypothetical protein
MLVASGRFRTGCRNRFRKHRVVTFRRFPKVPAFHRTGALAGIWFRQVAVPARKPFPIHLAVP